MDQDEFDNDDIDFSIIAPHSEKPKAVDFSVDSLLVDPPPQNDIEATPDNQPVEEAEVAAVVDGSFMRDLGKIEQEISYESQPYNIYESYELPVEFTGINSARQESTCTKTLNNLTKGASRILEPDFKHLILDFKEEKEENVFKPKQNFQDYYGSQTLLSKMDTKRQHHKSTNKTRKKLFSTKSPLANIYESSKSKPITVTSYHSRSRRKIVTEQTWVKSKGYKLPSKMDKDKTKSPFRRSSNSLQPKSQSKMTSPRTTSREKSNTIKMKKEKRRVKPNQDIYSEYYGFEACPSSRTCTLASDSKSKEMPKSKSKGKKIVFSRKIVNNHHS